MKAVPILVMILIAQSVCGASSVGSQELEPARPADSTTLESMLPEGIGLDACDMAIAPPKEELARGVLIAWNGAWTVRSLTTPQKADGARAGTAAVADRAALEQSLSNIVEERLADGASNRDRETGFSIRSMFIAIDSGASHTRLFDALQVCAAREIRAPRVWLLVRDLTGGLGVLAIHLPVDRGVDRPAPTAERVMWTLSRADETSIQGLPDVYALAHALRRANGDRKVRLQVRIPDSGMSVRSLVAVVNECRRFGFDFALSSKAIENDDSSPCAAMPGALVACEPRPTEIAEPPPKSPGKAVFGDPSSNG